MQSRVSIDKAIIKTNLTKLFQNEDKPVKARGFSAVCFVTVGSTRLSVIFAGGCLVF
ncbi:predicted protein [Arabidopsis lyrata subsp. lyrata]|uniref:Predicted protein n=1 Tax=Arabidopsis lyrata subsp. lyrata TaxID=81972 RepID=D7MUQ1_ARALL|nr:predicted protein [Arabidopsis lyrata subsp. lyrata]